MPISRKETEVQQATVATTTTTRIWSVTENSYSGIWNPNSGDMTIGVRWQVQGFDASNNELDYYLAGTFKYVAGVLTRNDIVTIYSLNSGSSVTFASNNTDDAIELEVTQSTATSFQYSIYGHIYILEEEK